MFVASWAPMPCMRSLKETLRLGVVRPPPAPG